MRGFTDLVAHYQRLKAEAEKTITEEGRHSAKTTIGGVVYEVQWGSYFGGGLSHDVVYAEIVVTGPTITGLVGNSISGFSAFHAKRGALPEDVREAILRGLKRLEAWQAGGPFPETVDALFAADAP